MHDNTCTLNVLYWTYRLLISLNYIWKANCENELIKCTDRTVQIVGFRWVNTYKGKSGFIHTAGKHKILGPFSVSSSCKLRLCSANHRPGYWSNLTCDWPSTAWAHSKQETENRTWKHFLLCWINAHNIHPLKTHIHPILIFEAYINVIST